MLASKIFLLLILSSHAFADPTAILFNREAASEEKEKAALELEKLGKDRPLTALFAEAELCYGVDLCARLDDEAPFKEGCTLPVSEFPADEVQGPATLCGIKYFRETYTCNEKTEPQRIKTVTQMGKMLEDANSFYTLMISEEMMSSVLGAGTPNKCEAKEKTSAFMNFLEKNPELNKKYEKMALAAPSLGQYTLECYDKINPLLFKRDPKIMVRYFNLFRAISDTMKLFPAYTGVVNRGTRLPPSVLAEHHKVGNIVCYDGFTSTAVDDPSDHGDNPRNSFLEGKCNQRLYIKTENNGAAPGRLIDKGSASQGENEVLFEPGACFRIDKVTPRTDNPGGDYANEKCEPNLPFNFEMTLVPSKK
jgi:hypothetical protein